MLEIECKRKEKNEPKNLIAHICSTFCVEEIVLLEANPVDKSEEQYCKKFFMFYEGPYTLTEK